MTNTEYHKINAPFMRDMDKPDKPLAMGAWVRPEYQYLSDKPWVWTEKIDGTNIRVIWSGGEVTFGGRTDNAHIPAHLIQHLISTFTPEKMRAVFPNTWAILYGEGCGPGIQNGGRYSPSQTFILFDALVANYWLQRDNVNDIAAKFGVPSAPYYGTLTLDEAITHVEQGVKSKFGDFWAEGLVGTPGCGLYDRQRHRIVLKVKHKDFYRGA